ncbi:MAG TPA: protein kinase [Gemmatimonadaceae bacterium]|nr:protein kinase [Gemmatimonadaceae bacterium]
MDLRERLQSTLGSTYSVERELGGGGMSRVFLAQETSLGRSVVVKVLSGNITAGISADRFAREVRLAASLQHPNIVPVLATGVADDLPYFTMPYVRGQSLRTRLSQEGTIPRRQALSILRDIARALQYAHGEGIVHRDIKPVNVLLSGDAAVVTDFGVAKAISVARTTADGAQGDHATLTEAGLTVGTPAYMAPEQAAADVIDHKVDIYAWGVLAYELLAGAHPFAGNVGARDLMVAHLTEKPVPLNEKVSDLAPELGTLVMKCLEKNAEDRPASALELLDALDASSGSRPSVTVPRVQRSRLKPVALIGAGLLTVAIGAYAVWSLRGSDAPAAINSVAVLPFVDDRADSANAYFGLGVADQLMTELAKVPGLRVASRTSAVAVGRRQDLDVREIARQLGVASVVEGTVRRAGDQLRVTAQLTNAADGLTLWSEAYERNSKDVFAVQDDITRSIVAALRPELGGNASTLKQEAPKGPGTTDTEAYDLYMRGLYLVERRGPGVQRAADYFSRAIEKDPTFARAYGALAGALEFFPYFAGVPAYRVEARARAAAERSLQLDPTLAEPRVPLAMMHWHAFRWDEADAEFRRAIAADSSSSVAHTQFGRYLLSVGNVRDALREFRTARRLDPVAGTSSVWLSYSLSRFGDKAGALAESNRARELDPTLITTFTVSAVDRANAGRLREALAMVANTNPPVPFNGMTAYVLEKSGDPSRAAEVRRMLDATPDSVWMVHTGRALAYVATADTAKALTELEAGIAQRETVAHWIPFGDPMWDPIRNSARFAEILRRIGLDGRGFTPVR